MVKKGLILLSLLMILLCSMAGAEDRGAWVKDYPKVPASRLVYKVPDGIAAEVEKEDGYISIHVLTAEMSREDWKLVMIDGGYPYVNVQPGVLRPEGYDTCMSFNGAIFDCVESDFYNDFANELANKPGIWDNNHDRHENGESIGEIVADQCMFIPAGGSTGGGFFICWMNRDAYQAKYPDGHVFTAAEMKDNPDGIFFYEYVETAAGIDTEEPFYVPFRSVSAAMMAPTKSASIPSGLRIKSIENGDITYLAENLTQTQDFVPVVFDAPDNAVHLVVYPPNHGSYKDVQADEWIAVSGDRATYYHQVHEDVCVSEEQLAAVWLDADGNIIDYGIFWFHVETPGYKPSGYYVNTWSAPPESRVELINNCEATGIKTSYDPASGIFHISYDEVDEVTGDVGWVGIRVKAPKGATAARINHGGGNQIMGPRDDMASSTHHIIVEQSYIDTVTVDEDGYITVIDMEPLRHYQAGPVDVYIQSGAVWPYGGGQSVIYWYEDANAADTNRANPVKIEYVADTTDVICVTSRTEIVDSEDKITNKPVDNVTCVKPGYGGRDWHLVIHRYPQRGDNACHWELYLENECGDYEPLTEESVIYMPYPNGHKYVEEKGYACDNDGSGNKCSYEIYHYNSEYSDCESLVGEHTPYGIKFKVDSLSPFVLDWGNFEGDLTPDQGEDDNNGDDNNDNNNSRKYNLHTLRLDRGVTTIQGGSIRDVQLCTNARLAMEGGRVENLSIDFTDDIQKSTMTGGSVETLFLVLNKYTPATISKPALTVSGNANVDVVFVGISSSEPPESTITGQMVMFEGASPSMLVIEGDPMLYDPAWLGGVSFDWVQVAGEDKSLSYAEFLAMIGK